MARYKDYKKDDRIASIRMFGLKDSSNLLNFRYEVWIDDYSDNEQRLPMPDKFTAEAYMKKNKWVEY